MTLVVDFSPFNSFSYELNGTRLQFIFSNHVFTRKVDGDPTALNRSYIFKDFRGTERLFDDGRYQANANLRQYLEQLPGKPLFDEGHGKALFFPWRTHRVILNMERQGGAVKILIDTAHQYPAQNLSKYQRMNFNVAVDRVATGKAPPLFPKRR